MRYKKIIIVAGTRPNFVKAAPLLRAFKALPKAERPRVLLLHTGQHYDYLMSKIFFEDLKIPRPDIFLNIKSRTPAGQTDEIIAKFQKALAAQKPDLVMVVGDVTGTMACALAAKMSGIKVAHVEAGLRSYDQSMPEERNRVLTDHVSDLLFTSCPEARGNLLKEGIDGRNIRFVGNVMIDTLKAEILKAEGRKNLTTKAELLKAEGRITKSRGQNKLQYEGRIILSQMGLQKGKETRPYVLLTLHRPSNVDDPKVLGPILKAFQKISKEVAVVFPAHPRTLDRLKTKAEGRKQITERENGKWEIGNGKSGLRIVPPLGYLDFIALQQSALCVFTDSGGVQEETSFLNVPCFTVRENTERPVTVSLGTNKIIGAKPGDIIQAWRGISRKLKVESIKSKAVSLKRRASIPKWDGHAAERIVAALTREPSH